MLSVARTVTLKFDELPLCLATRLDNDGGVVSLLLRITLTLNEHDAARASASVVVHTTFDKPEGKLEPVGGEQLTGEGKMAPTGVGNV